MFKILKYSWPALIIAAIIFYLSCLIPNDDIPDIPRFPHFDKIVHFLMYFGLSLTAAGYYIILEKGEIIVLKLILFAILLPILYGGLIEILQELYFNRCGDWFDFMADALGSLVVLPIALRFRRFMLKIKTK